MARKQQEEGTACAACAQIRQGVSHAMLMSGGSPPWDSGPASLPPPPAQHLHRLVQKVGGHPEQLVNHPGVWYVGDAKVAFQGSDNLPGAEWAAFGVHLCAQVTAVPWTGGRHSAAAPVPLPLAAGPVLCPTALQPPAALRAARGRRSCGAPGREPGTPHSVAGVGATNVHAPHQAWGAGGQSREEAVQSKGGRVRVVLEGLIIINQQRLVLSVTSGGCAWPPLVFATRLSGAPEPGPSCTAAA